MRRWAGFRVHERGFWKHRLGLGLVGFRVRLAVVLEKATQAAATVRFPCGIGPGLGFTSRCLETSLVIWFGEF